MVKNIFGGKNAKKRAKKFVNNRNATRQIEYKDTDQEYAKLTRKLGDCRFECICSDGRTRVAHIAGKFRGRWWFYPDDIVLVSIRIGIDSSKCDVLHKYRPQEIEQLQQEGLIDKMSVKENLEFEDEYIDDFMETTQGDEDDEIEIDISGL